MVTMPPMLPRSSKATAAATIDAVKYRQLHWAVEKARGTVYVRSFGVIFSART